MSQSRTRIRFPINQSEQAFAASRSSLLAVDVYERIREHLQASLEKADRLRGRQAAAGHRSHEAILLDGGRGTGKSSVLVNLGTYLEGDPLADRLLILAPVDPTLLEHGDDLLLNVIVAGLMGNPEVKAALGQGGPQADVFFDRLHKLGAALEGIQKQNDEYGLDKLRAFVGNQALGSHVHELFASALALIGKSLVVLPIDDVDTSLQLAFENVEVVRRYLTSPFVVPLMTGDLDLYDDVIWREFVHRLAGAERIDMDGAMRRGRDLAEEYTRKVLPLPRRIALPPLRSYLANRNIYLVDGDAELIALPLLRDWLEALLNERINGAENSYRELPLRTIREFAQFVHGARDLLPDLGKFFAFNGVRSDGQGTAATVKRLLLMSQNTALAVAAFGEQYARAFGISAERGRANRTGREQAYRALREAVARDDGPDRKYLRELTLPWHRALADYALYLRGGGATYLVADANAHFLQCAEDDGRRVLAHDLFRPQRHNDAGYRRFDERHAFASVWRHALAGRAPEQWLERLPAETLLSYPTPEVGALAKVRVSAEHPTAGELQLVRRLMTHWSFYSIDKRSTLVLCGRLFELIAMSLVRRVQPDDIMDLLERAPFYSLVSFANTKPLHMAAGADETVDDEQTDQSFRDEDALELSHAAARLAKAINDWRNRHAGVPPGAWLLFCVMNKFFMQAGHINPPRNKGMSMTELVNTGRQAFNTLWSAFGSFEKGDVFGLPRVVATVNPSDEDKQFDATPQYNQNIAPFLQMKSDTGYQDFRTGSITYALESHPLRVLLESLEVEGEGNIVEASAASGSRARVTATGVIVDARVARRFDQVVNKAATDTLLRLTADEIANTNRTKLKSFVSRVRTRCDADPALRALFEALPQLDNLPKNSGRRRLQRCMERLRGNA